MSTARRITYDQYYKPHRCHGRLKAFALYQYICGLNAGVMVKALDVGLYGHGIDFRPFRYR